MWFELRTLLRTSEEYGGLADTDEVFEELRARLEALSLRAVPGAAPAGGTDADSEAGEEGIFQGRIATALALIQKQAGGLKLLELDLLDAAVECIDYQQAIWSGALTERGSHTKVAQKEA